MQIQRETLSNLAAAAGLDISMYLQTFGGKVCVVCDILDNEQVISRLSTLQYEATTSEDDATRLVPLLVSNASVIINDIGGHPYTRDLPVENLRCCSP